MYSSRPTSLNVWVPDVYFQPLQDRSEKLYVHALHTVHALPDLRVAAGRLRTVSDCELLFATSRRRCQRDRNNFAWNVLHRRFNQVVDNGIDIAGLSPHPKLIVSRGAAVKNRMDVFDLFARA